MRTAQLWFKLQPQVPLYPWSHVGSVSLMLKRVTKQRMHMLCSLHKVGALKGGASCVSDLQVCVSGGVCPLSDAVNAHTLLNAVTTAECRFNS